MTEQERQDLVRRAAGLTWRGEPVSVGGWRNECASVSPRSGGFYRMTWESLAMAIETGVIGDGVGLWLVSGAWLGVSNEQR